MPINLTPNLPDHDMLIQQNVFTMPLDRALHQDIRPLEIVLLNLMPLKQQTELQILRMLGNSPLQTNVTFLTMSSHESTHVDQEYLKEHYVVFDQIRERRFDGMIITGAPVEMIPFEEVDYWPELCEIMEWTKTNVTSTYHICWGAQAGLYYHYGVPKKVLPAKMFGVFEHNRIQENIDLLRGFDDVFLAPHSRHTYTPIEEILKHPELKILSTSEKAGVYMIVSRDKKQVFVTGHSEYDATTLRGEYERDLSRGLPIEIPYNYFPNDDPSRTPKKTWRSHANLLYSNWLNYWVYQETLYDLGNTQDHE